MSATGDLSRPGDDDSPRFGEDVDSRGHADSSRRPGAVVLLAVVGILAVLSAMVLIPRMLSTASDPEQVARQFLEAVVAGETRTVREHLAPDHSAIPVLINDEIVQATEDRVSGYTIETVREREGQATVLATLAGGTTSETISLRLQESPGTWFRPASWELAPVEMPMLWLALPPRGLDHILVNGIEVPVADIFGHRDVTAPFPRFQVLPGTYEITLPENGELMTAQSVTTSVPATFERWITEHIPLQYELTATGEAEAQRLITDAVTVCSWSGLPNPEECPLIAEVGTAQGAAPVRGSWRITAMPELSYANKGSSLWVFSGADGSAEFIHQRRAQGTGEMETVTQTVPFDLRYGVRVVHDGTVSIYHIRDLDHEGAAADEEAEGD